MTVAPCIDLPDRTLLLSRMQIALTRDGRPARVAAILLDVGGLQSIGESLGHEAGDEVLAVIAGRLLAAIAPGDTLARVGDTEFAVLSEDIGGDGVATALATRLIEAVTPAVTIDDQELFLTACAGIAFAVPGVAATSVMRDASAALRRGQRRARGAVEVFDASIRSQLVERLTIETDLRRGIENGELRIAYQPLVSLRDRTVVGVEALVRWAHPTWGLVAPARFLPIAETSGLITRIGAWMLREACRQASSWPDCHPDRQPPSVTVNVSTQQLTDPGFLNLVADALDRAGLPPRRLVLDITEGAIHDDPSVLEVLDELKALGVRLFLDDFVTGQAALSWLTRFPLDGLKLDAPFVALVETPQTRSLLQAVCAMGSALDLTIVAEGVETEQQAVILEELGCPMAQGHLFFRPMPAAQLDSVLAVALPRRILVTPGKADVAPRGRAVATVTMREAAAALEVSASTVRRWSDDGRLKAIRTTGGHRRFLVEDVRQLRAIDEPCTGPQIRRVQPPQGALTATAALLGEHMATIIDAGLNATYHTRSRGWFAAPAGRSHLESWLRTLCEGLQSADYVAAIDATAALMRRARLGGATILEGVTFLDRCCTALLRLLSQDDRTRDELPAARRVCAALRHRALEDID